LAKNYDWEQIAKDTEEIYKSTVNKNLQDQ